jgi:small subunit ribosomal protein S1
MTSSNDQPSSSSTPASPASTPDALSIELSAAADAAMAGVMSAPDAPAAKSEIKPAQSAGKSGAKPGIRGPRVVQAGREHRTGKIVSVGPTDIFIEFGPKELGILSRVQFPEDKDLPIVGGELEVVIDKFEAGENYFVCSRPGQVQKAQWELLEAGQVVEARVTGVVTGKDTKQAGLELEVAGHRAFMPASQVSIERIPDLSVFIGEKMTCSVSRVERMGKGNIVLSRRDMLDAERKEKAKALLETIKEGDTIEGVVRKIMPFGAFVDMGGVDGLIHINDITFDRIGFGEKAIAKHVQEGQTVKVRVLKIDPPAEGETKRKIALGLKQIVGDTFATTASSLTEGSEVTGKVTKILEFGAFMEIAPGVEGLVHISELEYRRVAKVEDVLKVDEVVRAKILKIDPQTRRISLSVKALKAPPEMPASPEGKPGEGKAGGQGGGGRGFGGGGGFGGGRGGGGGKFKEKIQGRSIEEIQKETPALRRMREQNKKVQFKGGLS